MGGKEEITLFGGAEYDVSRSTKRALQIVNELGSGWSDTDWTASDDRVRGGKSQSHLEISDHGARFHGNLDIKTLGGAGFASQRTTFEDKSWDLSDYDGIRLDLGKSDGKRYTFIVKDELLPKNPQNGREQSTTSYEYDFTIDESAAMAESTFVLIPWDDFTPTYRGKEQKDAEKLDKKNVKRFSFMMRSFFGDQEGDFSLNIKSVKAVSIPADLEAGPAAREKGALSPPNARSVAGRLFTRLMLVNILGIGIVTYGVCMILCTYVKDAHVQLPWHTRHS